MLVGQGGIVRLQFEGDELRFIVPAGGAASEERTLLAGSVARARSILRHEPATAAELEAAIAEVEDLVMPVIRMLPSDAMLEASGPEFGEVLGQLPDAVDGKRVPIEAVERLFNRLADVAGGSPAGSQGVPARASFALGLVVLREVMHHGGYRSVTCHSMAGCPMAGLPTGLARGRP